MPDAPPTLPNRGRRRWAALIPLLLAFAVLPAGPAAAADLRLDAGTCASFGGTWYGFDCRWYSSDPTLHVNAADVLEVVVPVNLGDYVNDGTTVLHGGSFTMYYDKTNNGTIRVEGAGNRLVNQQGTFTNAGTITLSAGGSLVNDGDGTSTAFVNNGTVTVGAGSTLVTSNGASLTNNGTITLLCGGTVSGPVLGNPPTVLPGDCEAPTATPTQAPSPNSAGWNTTDVTVTWHWSDNVGGSGIDPAKCTTTSVSSGEGTLSLTATCTDLAGNTGTATRSVKIDTRAPTISCAAADTAWHAADVSIPCTAWDTGSGLAASGDAAVSLTTSVPAGTETATAATGSRTVTDRAGLTATAGPLGGLKVDKKKPSITVATPSAGATYQLHQPVTADYVCTDGGSGVATCTGPVADGAPIDTGSVGGMSFSVASTDAVGNAGGASLTYTVTYPWTGFFRPVDIPPAVNVAKGGSAIPVVFALGGNQGLNVLAAGSPASRRVDCVTGSPLGASEPTSSPGGSGLTYDATSGRYSYVWKSEKAWSGQCRRLDVALVDGSHHVADFRFT